MPHKKRLIDLDRDECVTLLEGVGIACYESEDKATLIEAVRANLEDGTLSEEALPDEDRDTFLYARGLSPRPVI